MDEQNEKIEGGEVKIKLPTSKKLENFWYYYKWHTIVGVFLVFVAVVLLLQTCGKVKTDAYILYAGPHDVSRVAQNGDISEYESMLSTFKRVCKDQDGDGLTTIALLDLFVVNQSEANRLLEENPGSEINAALVKEDTDTLQQKLVVGEYYLCFLSERLFFEYEEAYEGKLFAPIAAYTKDGGEYEYASEHGIYLSSLPFSELPTIADLPSDTVVCIRRFGGFGMGNDEDQFKVSEEILRNILSYGISN